MTIGEAQRDFIETFNSLDDWFMQYELLLEIAGTTPLPDEKDKNESSKIHSCQADAWMVLKTDGTRLLMAADSSSLIIRGILGVFVLLLHGRTLLEAADAQICFLEQTAISRQLSTEQRSGMNEVIKRIQNYCSSAV